MHSDQIRIAAYYDRLVDEYGHDPRAVDASSEAALNVRYRVLADVADLTGASILEVGCGFGDLGVFLHERYEGIRYRGIDVSARMIEEGRRLHPALDLAQVNLLDLNPAELFDFVLAQGIFYLLAEPAEPKMHGLIERMFALATQAIALTTTSAWSSRSYPGEFYADPVRLLEWARHLTSAVVVRHDYHPGDVALYLYKPREATT